MRPDSGYRGFLHPLAPQFKGMTMAKKRVHKKTIPDAKTEREAIDYMMAAIAYFLRKHTIKTLMFMGLLFGAPGYVFVDWYTTDRVGVEVAKPIGSNFEIMPQAYAGGEPIILNGKTWGYKSPRYEAWVLDDNRILVYDKETKGDPVIVRMDNAAQQYQKRK